MKKNAYKYGFIMRYIEDKTNITGYKVEPWHYRYVGEEVAKYIYEHDLTFDEYYAMFIANKKD
jgi:D-alanyl-D-alanine carboxypeptidase